MRILVTAYTIGPRSGGARVGILAICQGLARRGHEVTLFATNADGNGVVDVPLGVPTLQDGVQTYFYPVQVSIFGNALSIPMARALKAEIPRSDIVLLHSLYQFTPTIAAYYCREFRVPYVLRPHGTLDPFLVYRRRWPLKWAYIKFFEVRNFRHSAAIQYSSVAEAEMTRRFIPGTLRSLIIPEGIALEKFSKLPLRGTFRSRYPETIGKTVVLFLGRFDQKKGVELLEAFSNVAPSRADLHLLLVGGGDNDYIDQIMDLLRVRGMKGRFTYAGMVSDQEKMAALADADIFALSSRGENFGIAVVEAMASGLPVLISDQVGIHSEITAGEAGLVTRCDVQEITGALELLVDDPGLRRRLGQKAKELARTHFSLDSMAEKMEQAYVTFVNQSKDAAAVA